MVDFGKYGTVKSTTTTGTAVDFSKYGSPVGQRSTSDSPIKYDVPETREDMISRFQEESRVLSGESKRANSTMEKYVKPVANALLPGVVPLGETIASTIKTGRSSKNYESISETLNNTNLSLVRQIRKRESEGKDSSDLKREYNKNIDQLERARKEFEESTEGSRKTTRQVTGELGMTTLNVLTAGTYGKAASMMKTGQLSRFSSLGKSQIAKKGGMEVLGKTGKSEPIKIAYQHIDEAKDVIKNLPESELESLGGAQELVKRTVINISDGLSGEGFKQAADIVRSIDPQTIGSIDDLQKVITDLIPKTSGVPSVIKTAAEVLEKPKGLFTKQGLGRVALGAGIGEGYDITQNLQEGKTGSDVFTEGYGKYIGLGLPLVVGSGTSLYNKVSEKGTREALGNIYRKTASKYTRAQAVIERAETIHKTDPIGILQMYGKETLPEVTHGSVSTQGSREFLVSKIKEISEIRNDDLFLSDVRIEVPDYRQYANDIIDGMFWSLSKKDKVRREVNKIIDEIEESYKPGKTRTEGLPMGATSREMEMGSYKLKDEKGMVDLTGQYRKPSVPFYSATQKQVTPSEKTGNLDEFLKKEGGESIPSVKTGIDLNELGRIKTEQTNLSKSYNNKKPRFDYDAHAVVGKAARDLIELSSESDLTKDLNRLIQSHYDAIDYLNAIEGKKIHGGSLSRMFNQLAGNVVGGMVGSAAGHPFIGASTGHVIANQVSDIVQNRFITNPIKSALINNLKAKAPKEVDAAIKKLESKYGDAFQDLFLNKQISTSATMAPAKTDKKTPIKDTISQVIQKVKDAPKTKGSIKENRTRKTKGKAKPNVLTTTAAATAVGATVYANKDKIKEKFKDLFSSKFYYSNPELADLGRDKVNKGEGKEVEVSAYSPTVDQTDDRPREMASGKEIYEGAIATGDRTIPFGTQIYIPELDRVFIVEDRMDKRYQPKIYKKTRFDILFPEEGEKGREKAIQHGVQNYTYVIIGHDGR